MSLEVARKEAHFDLASVGAPIRREGTEDAAAPRARVNPLVHRLKRLEPGGYKRESVLAEDGEHRTTLR